MTIIVAIMRGYGLFCTDKDVVVFGSNRLLAHLGKIRTL